MKGQKKQWGHDSVIMFSRGVSAIIIKRQLRDAANSKSSAPILVSGYAGHAARTAEVAEGVGRRGLYAPSSLPSRAKYSRVVQDRFLGGRGEEGTTAVASIADVSNHAEQQQVPTPYDNAAGEGGGSYWRDIVYRDTRERPHTPSRVYYADASGGGDGGDSASAASPPVSVIASAHSSAKDADYINALRDIATDNDDVDDIVAAAEGVVGKGGRSTRVSLTDDDEDAGGVTIAGSTKAPRYSAPPLSARDATEEVFHHRRNMRRADDADDKIVPIENGLAAENYGTPEIRG
eukprot:jgi/Bigna1/139047/aug1.48_g13755